MERIFKLLTQISANLLLVLLVSTVVVLYWTAKPAIEEFGAYFIVDSRWAVDVKVPTESEGKAAGQTDSKPGVGHADKPVKNSEESDANLDDLDAGIDDDISMDDDTTVAGLTSGEPKNTKTVYGGAVPIVGTIFATLIAMIFSIPLAMGIAVFLSEIASPIIAKPVGIAIELLAAIPSIIYGMWALFYFGPFIASIFGGHTVSLLVAGLVLGVMVIPFMAALSRDAINTAPDVLKEAAYAVGATKFEVIKDIIFPYAKAGIIGSIIISLGRALGETMAVAFVIGGIFQYATSITAPTNSIPVVLANNFAESSGLSLSVLFYLALILFVVSFIIIFAAKHYFLRRGKI